MHEAKLHDLSQEGIHEIRESLLKWYAQNARELPWRLPPVDYATSPYNDYALRLYKCMLSEMMLQQTQVKTVISYYDKWLLKFPTIEELAEAPEEDVMACWSGLGYYSRAKRLHQAAKHLVTNFVSKGLEFPMETDYWIKHVPGVGPYTAGAILSIALNQQSAIIDGNVQRVLSRILAIHGDTSTVRSPGSMVIWEIAARLVAGREPGNLNQSLMELGATLCTPKQADCPSCPISTQCTAYQQWRNLRAAKRDLWSSKSTSTSSIDMEDLCTICPSTIDPTVFESNAAMYIQGLYPFKAPKKKPREETAIVLVITNNDGQAYLEKKVEGLLAGLYDFPTILLGPETTDGGQTIISKHERKLGAINVGCTIHLFTHIRRKSHVLVCDQLAAMKALEAFAQVNDTGQWLSQDRLSHVGISELCLKNWRLASGSSSHNQKMTNSKGQDPKRSRKHVQTEDETRPLKKLLSARKQCSKATSAETPILNHKQQSRIDPLLRRCSPN